MKQEELRGILYGRKKETKRELKRMGIGGRLPGWLGFEAPGDRLGGRTRLGGWTFIKARDQVYIWSLE